MKNINVFIVNAFVEDDGSGGNPAGVVFDADALSPQEKQMISRRVGLSETAFVSKSKTADFKIEFFTPTRQIPHCGHATVGTFCLLAEKGLIAKDGESSKETSDGTRRIFMTLGQAYLEQTAPKYGDLKDTTEEEILSSLHISHSRSQFLKKPQIVSTANRLLLIPLCDGETLGAVNPQMKDIEKISEKNDLVGYYVFTTEAKKAGRTASARMFAPRYGIQEESATGTGAGALACYLYDFFEIRNKQMILEQGVYMNPPAGSKINAALEVNGNSIQSVRVGGKACLKEERRIAV